MNHRFHVYGIGNAIMDLQLKVSEQDLIALDLRKGGMTLVAVEDQKRFLEYFHGYDLNQASGGSGANTVIAISQLGGKVAYGCLVGDDRFGDQYEKEMNSLGVFLHNKAVPKETTGTCVILISPDAERTMNTHLGASARFSEEHISKECIAQAQWLYVEGYLFSTETGQQAIRKAIEVAKASSTKVALTFSDAFIVNAFNQSLSEAVSQADLIFANLTEARAFTGTSGENEVFSKLKEAAPNAIMTLSERGSKVFFEGQDYTIPPFPTQAIDDTGAGDIYAAGFLYGITNQQSPLEAGKLASFLASKVVAQLGPRLRGNVRQLVTEMP